MSTPLFAQFTKPAVVVHQIWRHEKRLDMPPGDRVEISYWEVMRIGTVAAPLVYLRQVTYSYGEVGRVSPNCLTCGIASDACECPKEKRRVPEAPSMAINASVLLAGLPWFLMEGREGSGPFEGCVRGCAFRAWDVFRHSSTCRGVEYREPPVAEDGKDAEFVEVMDRLKTAEGKGKEILSSWYFQPLLTRQVLIQRVLDVANLLEEFRQSTVIEHPSYFKDLCVLVIDAIVSGTAGSFDNAETGVLKRVQEYLSGRKDRPEVAYLLKLLALMMDAYAEINRMEKSRQAGKP